MNSIKDAWMFRPLGWLRENKHKRLHCFLMLVILASIGCSRSPDQAFEYFCKQLDISPQVTSAIREYRNNRGANNLSHFDTIRAFFISRQLVGSDVRGAEKTTSILTADNVVQLLGLADVMNPNGTWIYYFDAAKTWHIELSFLGDQLHYTSHRQVYSLEGTSGGSDRVSP